MDVMIAIRSNFFYTRSVPCELWFLNRNKPTQFKDKVLMLDARNVYRQVTARIYDFSPEQQKNLLAIIWLYRDQQSDYLGLVSEYLGQVVDEGLACVELSVEDGEVISPLLDFGVAIHDVVALMRPFLGSLKKTGPHIETVTEFEKTHKLCNQDIEQFQQAVTKAAGQWENAPDTNAALTVEVTDPDIVAVGDLVFLIDPRQPERQPRICLDPVGIDLIHIKWWIRHHIVRLADQLMRVLVVGDCLLDITLESMHGQVHLCKSNGRRVLLQTSKGEFFCRILTVFLYQSGALDKHTTGTTGRVQYRTTFWVEHMGD